MTQTTEPVVLDDVTLDALAFIAATIDDGPDALDVPDTPDEFDDRDPSPRPEDGPQDVSQQPDEEA
jgi:hypothetical protein